MYDVAESAETTREYHTAKSAPPQTARESTANGFRAF